MRATVFVDDAAPAFVGLRRSDMNIAGLDCQLTSSYRAIPDPGAAAVVKSVTKLLYPDATCLNEAVFDATN